MKKLVVDQVLLLYPKYLSSRMVKQVMYGDKMEFCHLVYLLAVDLVILKTLQGLKPIFNGFLMKLALL